MKSKIAKGIRQGDYYAQCDVCGGHYFASSMKIRWDNLFVCLDDWEERHPQDYVKPAYERNRKVLIARPLKIDNNTAEFNPIATEADTANWY